MSSEEQAESGAQAIDSEQAAEAGKNPAPPERERRPANWLAGLALVIALVALAGVAASGWAWYQLRGEQSRISMLEGRASALDGRIAALERSAASARELTALQQRVASQARAARSRASAYAARIDDLSSRLANGVASYREDEAEMLMRLAQDQLAVAGDPRASLRALQLADQALAAANEPRLAPVRTALAREIQALGAVPRVDVDGAVARLGAISSQVDGFPLAEERFMKAPAAATGAEGSWSWHKLGAAFKRAFSPLIVIRHGPVARPLLPPREAYFVRQNLKLSLAGARAALLERDAASYRASLAEASQWLDDWFDTQAPGVAAARAALSRLSNLDLEPPLPTLGAALSRLRAIRSGTGSP